MFQTFSVPRSNLLAHRETRKTPKLAFGATKHPFSHESDRFLSCIKASVEDDRFDVSRAIVQPSFRSAPWEGKETNPKVCILFVSESNVCRSILAESIMLDLLKESGLDSLVHCESRASRDYNIGEGPDESVIAAAENLSIVLREDKKAELFDHEKDIVIFDLILVMDKFTAADVLREVSVYDTIQKEKHYSLKIRRLGEFHPQLKHKEEADGQDIDDPLYGNYGGDSTRVEKASRVIEASCLGLLETLQDIEVQCHDDKESFKTMIQNLLMEMECIDWLVPPMLQSKSLMDP